MKTKQCITCGEVKPNTRAEFRKWKNQCRDCYRAKGRLRREENQRYLRIYKEHEGFCVVCGDTDNLATKHLHHVKFPKRFNPTDVSGYSLATLFREWMKCDLVCAGKCHAKAEAELRGIKVSQNAL